MQHSAASAFGFLVTLGAAAGGAAQVPATGHRLFHEITNTHTPLVDSAGNLVHAWPGVLPAQAVHLDADGSLLRALQVAPAPGGGGTGALQRVAFDGTVEWWYVHNGPGYTSHHGVHPMPNGNVLLIVWERKTAAEAIARGRDPALLGGGDFWPDSIVEVEPTGPVSGRVVWEWHVWDHLIQDFDPTLPDYGVVADHPERLDINFPPVVPINGDWNHINAVDYDPIHDWLVLSAREQSEIWIIDHGTTTAEAAGHTGGRWGKGGDLLYRWGNPQAYDRGTPRDQQLKYQHDPRFIPPEYPGAGNLTIFNNVFAPGRSAVHEIVLPLDPSGRFLLASGRSYGPAAPVWTYASPTLYSFYVSSAQRLPNGNTLICSGLQRDVFEVTPEGRVAWRLDNSPIRNAVFRAHYVERSLWSSDTTVSATAGGNLRLDVLAGTGSSGDPYLILGSASGTTPGFGLAGVSVPLNRDYLFFAMASAPNSGIFRNNIGLLDRLGRARADLLAPPAYLPPGMVGTRLDFAGLLFDQSMNPLSASNPVPVRIVP